MLDEEHADACTVLGRSSEGGGVFAQQVAHQEPEWENTL